MPLPKEEVISRITPYMKAIFEVFVEDWAEGQADDELREKMAKAVETAMIGMHAACDVLPQSHGKGIARAEVTGGAPRVMPSILLDPGLAVPTPPEPTSIGAPVLLPVVGSRRRCLARTRAETCLGHAARSQTLQSHQRGLRR